MLQAGTVSDAIVKSSNPGCVENDYIQIEGILEVRHDCVLPL